MIWYIKTKKGEIVELAGTFCKPGHQFLFLCGFSAIHVPFNIHPLLIKGYSSAVLHHCVSDPYHLPKSSRASNLSPLQSRFWRSMSDLFPPPLPCLNCKEIATPDSVSLRMVNDHLKEMIQLWDELIKDDDQEDRGEDECLVSREGCP
ncbi:hypothetical protein Fmac_021371 [Flemingia macrophylla]|uniref:Uncharacterized protein n=1 Tax=Flemingia macrophylla TaxID=520843 RepID=A0ABD1LWQ7_9FABA